MAFAAIGRYVGYILGYEEKGQIPVLDPQLIEEIKLFHREHLRPVNRPAPAQSLSDQIRHFDMRTLHVIPQKKPTTLGTEIKSFDKSKLKKSESTAKASSLTNELKSFNRNTLRPVQTESGRRYTDPFIEKLSKQIQFRRDVCASEESW